VTAGGGGKAGLIDPIGTAEDIIRMRGAIAEEWKATMGRVREDHTGIRQALLSRQMKRQTAFEENGEGEDACDAFQ